MLRITVHEDSTYSRLELAGRLEGPWVTETEHAWRASLRPQRKIEIDLRQLTGIDNAGRDLLAAIQRAGACLIVDDRAHRRTQFPAALRRRQAAVAGEKASPKANIPETGEQ